MSLVVVLNKRSRLASNSSLNFHTFKCFGGVINTKTNRGQGYYIRREIGQDQKVVVRKLMEIRDASQSSTRVGTK